MNPSGLGHVRDSFVPNEYVDGIVSYVEGPHRFYIQPLSMSQDIRRLCKKMHFVFSSEVLDETDYTLTMDYLAICLRSGQPCWCAAPFEIPIQNNPGSVHVDYCRAVVLERVGPSTVKVFYIDYGNTGKVPIGHLKSLPNSVLEFPIMAAPCCMAEYAVAADKNLFDTNKLIQLVDGYHIVAQVKSNNADVNDQRMPWNMDPIFVSLYITDGKEDVNVADTLLAI